MDSRLVVIALDGGDHRVLAELLEAGRLPSLAAVWARGTCVEAQTIGGVFEESTWPTVFSGTGLGDHGAQHFTQFDAATHGLRIEREPPDLEPFWLHLPDRGRGVLAVDLPQVHPHPASEADEVCCWSAWSPPHPPSASPRSLTRELGPSGTRRWLREFDHEPTLDDERSLSARLVEAVGHRCRRVTDAGRRRRVVCFGVEELHAVAHVLGHHWLDDHPHQPWPREPELVTAVYEATDAAIRDLVTDPATNVMVLASQGFRPADSSNPVLDGLLARAGLAVRPGAGSGGDDAASAWIAPVRLMRRWLPDELRERLAVRFLPTSVQQRLMSQKFRTHLDWGRTSVFSLPSWGAGYLRVNLTGREEFGIVAPEDCEALLDSVVELLGGLVEEATGRPMVRDVLRMRRQFSGARADDLPDVVVEWALDHPVRRVAHPRFGTWEADSGYHRHRWCDHHGEAVGYLAGPDIRKSDEPLTVEFEGAAPTFLRLLGVGPPSNMASSSWDAVLR